MEEWGRMKSNCSNQFCRWVQATAVCWHIFEKAQRNQSILQVLTISLCTSVKSHEHTYMMSYAEKEYTRFVVTRLCLGTRVVTKRSDDAKRTTASALAPLHASAFSHV